MTLNDIGLVQCQMFSSFLNARVVQWRNKTKHYAQAMLVLLEEDEYQAVPIVLQ